VVFDLDGTLIDSAPALNHAVNGMLADLGRPPLDLARTTGFIGAGVGKLVERALAATGGPAPRARALFDARYAATPTALTRLFPGAPEALGALQARGLRLGLCTNKPQGPADKVLAETGLAPFFDAAVGAREGLALKPDPAPLRLCLSELGAAAGEALYVGDSEVDAETAQAAGVRFALFTRGYRKTPAEALPALWRFNAFAALPDFVEALAARAAE
jgi:phosphoglycolate phosphatase